MICFREKKTGDETGRQSFPWENKTGDETGKTSFPADWVTY